MSIGTSVSRVIGQGNGVTTQFNYGFLIPTAAALVVTVVSPAGVQTVLTPSQFTVAGIGLAQGGSVTYPLAGPPLAAGYSIVIQRQVPYTQPTTLVNQGAFHPAAVEAALDNLEMQIQQAVAAIGLGIMYPAVDVNPVSVLPAAGARAGKFFGFDGNGNPTMLNGNLLAGDLLPYTVGGAAWSNALYATQNLISFNAGWFSTYASALAATLYGFAASITRTAGADATEAGHFAAIAQNGVTGALIGMDAVAIAQAGASSPLYGATVTVENQTHNNVSLKRGVNVSFMDRDNSGSAAPGGLGANEYNLAASALYFDSQQRSSSGEFCGWRRGIEFAEFSMDNDVNGGGIGIDFAKVHYYGGSNPLTAYRMAAAIRMRDYQSILWNGDPTLPNDPTEPTFAVRTLFSAVGGRWILTYAANERFGVDVNTGDIYVNGVIFSGSGTGLLVSNNVWSGTNTFNAAIALGTNLTFSGTGRRILGDLSNGTAANRLLFQSSVVNGSSRLGVIPNGSSQGAELGVINDSAATNGSILLMTIDASPLASITAGAIGGGTNPALAITVGGAERMRILTGGAVCINTTGAPTPAGCVLRVNGIVQIDNTCSFRVHKNGANQALVDGAAPALVTWSTKSFDQDNVFNTGTGQLTPKVGKYFLHANIVNAGSIDQANWAVWIYKNGVVLATGSILTCRGTTVGGANVSCTVDANGTDTFEIRAQSANGGGTGMTISGIANDSYFTGFRVG